MQEVSDLIFPAPGPGVSASKFSFSACSGPFFAISHFPNHGGQEPFRQGRLGLTSIYNSPRADFRFFPPTEYGGAKEALSWMALSTECLTRREGNHRC